MGKGIFGNILEGNFGWLLKAFRHSVGRSQTKNGVSGSYFNSTLKPALEDIVSTPDGGLWTLTQLDSDNRAEITSLTKDEVIHEYFCCLTPVATDTKDARLPTVKAYLSCLKAAAAADAALERMEHPEEEIRAHLPPDLRHHPIAAFQAHG